MASQKSVKVKDIAAKYSLPPKDVVSELKAQGVNVSSASSVIPEDALEYVELVFSEAAEAKAKEKKKAKKAAAAAAPAVKEKPKADPNVVYVESPVIVKALAAAMGMRPNEVVSGLMRMNVLASINQTVPDDKASEFVRKQGKTLVFGAAPADDEEEEEEVSAPEPKKVKVVLTYDPEDEKADDPDAVQVPRPPIVTFMGHVDHGKTSLQDYIRKSHVAAGEAGGITQSIGASVAEIGGKTITFVDTPGHEAFTQMRARGANVTDLVVLVVAADDGFMPQTVEALNHAKAAGVKIIVAINKIDLPTADPDKVLLNMQQNGLTPLEWGGDVESFKVSAKTGQGVPELLEQITLEAEMMELKCNPKRKGIAYVLESQLEQGFGPTAHVVVKNGTLHLGDPVICGEYCGKIRSMIDSHGRSVKSAGPATPVKVAGLSGVPEAGSKMAVCESEAVARQLAEQRAEANRQASLSKKTASLTTLEDLFKKADEGNKKQLAIVLKADVKGSVEAISESLMKLPSEKIAVNIVHSGVGAITETDVLLARSSGGIVVGFHVRVNPGVNAAAKKEGVEIRLYSIIYELLEDIEDALAGRLEPEKREKDLGTARILQIFELSKGPKVCGCKVEKGLVKVGLKARVYRKGELIFNGEVRSLRRFHDDVKEVREGLECGIRLDNFADFEPGDMIQLYEIELKKATLA